MQLTVDEPTTVAPQSQPVPVGVAVTVPAGSLSVTVTGEVTGPISGPSSVDAVRVNVPLPPVTYGPSLRLASSRRGSGLMLSTLSPRISWMFVLPPVDDAKPNLKVGGGFGGSGWRNSSRVVRRGGSLGRRR